MSKFKIKMKKYIFIILLAFSALSFTSCKENALEPSILPKENPLDSIDILSEFDTPFVVYDGKNYIFKRILSKSNGEDLITKDFSVSKDENIEFTVFINFKNKDFKDFKVKLNSEQNFESPEIWQTNDQIFVVSDFEGEFYHFVELLRGAKIIDSEYNWTFGNNHLVVLGDIFDRGDMVHECLWLLYKLETEGANIHFIHGNHDVMNISGNQTNYINKKYFRSLKAVGYDKIENFYKPNTVLGKWLRSKNFIEKGNDVLFVHGGISKNLIALYPDLTINQVNTVAKRNFDTPKSEESIAFLSGSNSLTWFRGYFNRAPEHTQGDVEMILGHFNSSMICVGHTVQQNVGLFYNNKVACTDVNVHDGVRQGLLFDKKSIYRIDVSIDLDSPEITKLK